MCCRIHQKINLANLSDRLDLLQGEEKKWIVSSIRETKVGVGADTKVDLEEVRLSTLIFLSWFSPFP